MIFKFVLISDEAEDFLREISIDADSTFLDLNKAILVACGYSDDQITSFYTCNDEWEQEEQITREDMGFGTADHDVYIMEKTELRNFINDEDQKLVFVFDPFNDRVFYMKVSEIITGKNLKKPECTRKEGTAPRQINDMDSNIPTSEGSDDFFDEDEGSDFFGSDGFNEEDIDFEGFEIEEH